MKKKIKQKGRVDFFRFGSHINIYYDDMPNGIVICVAYKMKIKVKKHSSPSQSIGIKVNNINRI